MLTLIEQQETKSDKWNKEETKYVQKESKCCAGHNIHINSRRVYILQLVKFMFEYILSAIRSYSRQTIQRGVQVSEYRWACCNTKKKLCL